MRRGGKKRGKGTKRGEKSGGERKRDNKKRGAME